MKLRLPVGMGERTIWALWWLLFAGASLWMMVGSAAFFVRGGYLPPDTSGWAQALGGFLAVAVAIAVPYFQARKAMIDREKESLLSRASDCSAVYSLVSHFQGLMHRSRVESIAVGKNRFVHDVTLVRELRDASTLLRDISVNSFSSEMVFYVLGLRRTAAFCEVAAGELETAVGAYFSKSDLGMVDRRAATELVQLDDWAKHLNDYEARLRQLQ